MRLRTIGASLGALALIGASLLVPASVALADPPDQVQITGTIGAPTVDNPRIGLQGVWTVPSGSPNVTSVEIRHSMDPAFATSTVWCASGSVNVTGFGFTCTAANGGQLQQGLNYFRAVADNGDGLTTSATFPASGQSFDRTPIITSPASGTITKDASITFNGLAYPNTTMTVDLNTTSQPQTMVGQCTDVADAAGAWSCPIDVSALGDAVYLAGAVDSASVPSSAVMVEIDRTAPAPPIITSPPSPTNTTLTDHNVEGTGEADATVEVTYTGTPDCVTTADAVGDWSCLVSLPPSQQGSYQITATQTDAAANISPTSNAVSINVVAETTITAPATGASLADPRPTVSGTAQPSANVTVQFWGATSTTCATVANATTGAYSCSPTVQLLPGGYQVIAQNSDHNLNSSPLTLNVVSGAPTVTTPADGFSIGQSRPTISGNYTGDDVTSLTVEHSIDGIYFYPYCTDAAPSGGLWSCASTTTDFEIGANDFYATAFAGTTYVGQSATSTVQRAANPSITAPAGGSRHTAIPAVTGTAYPLASIELRDSGGANVLCTATTTAAGSWTCTPTTLAFGDHSVVAVDTTHGLTSAPRAFTRVAPPVPQPVSLPPPPGPITWSFSLESGGPVVPGSTVTIIADGLPAGSEILVELHSTPRTLGSTVVGSDGSLSHSVLIPSDAEPGDHTLVLTLKPPGGVHSTVTHPLAIEAPAPAATDDEEPIDEPAAVADEEAEDAGNPGPPIRGPLPDLPRTDPAAPTSLTESVPTAIEVVLSPGSVFAAGGMAIALLILVALPTEILNATISANSRRFGKLFTWFDDATTRASAWLSTTFRTTAVPAVLLIALTAIVFSFSDPAVGFDLASLRLFASLGIALFIVTWVASRISEVTLEKRFGIQSDLLLNPAALVFAVIGVVIARLLDFSPGFLIGLVIGLELATNIAEKHRVRAIVVQVSVILGLSVAAWLGYSLMVAIHADGPTGVVTALVHDTLVAVVSEGLVAVTVAILPLSFLDGHEVFNYSKRLWAGMFLVIGTAFALLVLPNELNGQEVRDLGVWALVFLGYTAGTMAIWLILKFAAKYDDDASIERQRAGT